MSLLSASPAAQYDTFVCKGEDGYLKATAAVAAKDSRVQSRNIQKRNKENDETFTYDQIIPFRVLACLNYVNYYLVCNNLPPCNISGLPWVYWEALCKQTSLIISSLSVNSSLYSISSFRWKSF